MQSFKNTPLWVILTIPLTIIIVIMGLSLAYLSYQNSQSVIDDMAEDLLTESHAHIETHIESCKPCQVCLETLKQTVALCKNLEHRQVPEAFTLRLKDAIADLVKKKPD